MPLLPTELARLLARYHAHLLHERQLDPSTVDGVCRTLARFWRSAGIRKAGRVTPAHYDAFLRAVPDPTNGQTGGRAYRPGTRAQYAARILLAYRDLAAEGWIRRNPLHRCKAPTAGPVAARDVDAGKVNWLAAAIADDLRLLVAVYLLYLAGLRRAEAVGARVEDLDLDSAKPILVVLGKGRGGGKERTVPVHPLMVGPVRQLVAGRAAGPLLANRYNPHRHLTPGYLGKLFRQAARDAGLAGLTPHMLRWSCARHLMDAGATEREVADLLGHTSVAMTRRYTMGHRSRLHRTVGRLRLQQHRVAERPPRPAPAIPPPRREPGVRCCPGTSRTRKPTRRHR